MKIWHINTIKFHSARNKDGLINFANQRVELESIIFSE